MLFFLGILDGRQQGAGVVVEALDWFALGRFVVAVQGDLFLCVQTQPQGLAVVNVGAVAGVGQQEARVFLAVVARMAERAVFFGLDVFHAVEELDRVVELHAAVDVDFVARAVANGFEKQRDGDADSECLDQRHDGVAFVRENFGVPGRQVGADVIQVWRAVFGLQVGKGGVSVAKAVFDEFADPVAEEVALVPAELFCQATNVADDAEAVVHEVAEVGGLKDFALFMDGEPQGVDQGVDGAGGCSRHAGYLVQVASLGENCDCADCGDALDAFCLEEEVSELWWFWRGVEFRVPKGSGSPSFAGQITQILQLQKDLLHGLVRFDVGGINPQLGCLRLFVGVRYPGELLDDSLARFLVQPLAVALFAHFQRGGYVDFDEAAVGFDHVAHFASCGRVRGDGGADGDAAVLGDFAGDEADAQDVEVAVFFRKAQLARQVLSDDVAVEQGDLAPAQFHQLDLQGVGQG